MANISNYDRHFYLFDSFEGLPKAGDLDGEAAAKYQQEKNDPHYFDNCRAEISFAEKAMQQTGHVFSLIKGWFKDTIPNHNSPKSIAVLRLDGDWYDSTMICLEHLMPKVSMGGIIIIDDYFNWDGCTLAVHDYLSKNRLPIRLHSTKSGVCYFYKTHSI